MKRSDLYFAIVMLAIFVPFFASSDLYAWYKTFNAEHAMIMAFLKFGILATLGEMLGYSTFFVSLLMRKRDNSCYKVC